MDDKQLLELIFAFLEEKGLEVEYIDHTGGELYIYQEDTNLGLKVKVEVVP